MGGAGGGLQTKMKNQSKGMGYVEGCICSNCRNLKSVLNEETGEIEFECKYGFPSDECANCDRDDCEITCEHYEENDEEPVIVYCSRCGRELKKVVRDDEEGEILCIDCFLNG